MTDVFEYLCVDKYLAGFMDVQALKSAFDIGLIDRLANQSMKLEQLFSHDDDAPSGISILLEMLVSNQVLDNDSGQFSLSESFRQALCYRDLMEKKIEFSNLVSPDMINHSNAFFNDLPMFMSKSKTFDLFDYQRCYESTTDNVSATRQWMAYTTVYTRYESRVCIEHHDFGQCKKLMDIGGNSGEFVLQICKQYPDLLATVVDLPVVCDIGREHVASEPEAQRIEFLKRDVLRDELPSGYDVVSFKSLLHDWPEEASLLFIKKAWQSLKPGGTLLIFERGPVVVTGKSLGYSMLPIFLFARFYRDSSVYMKQLAATGFVDIQSQMIDLDVPFSLITATKPD